MPLLHRRTTSGQRPSSPCCVLCRRSYRLSSKQGSLARCVATEYGSVTFCQFWNNRRQQVPPRAAPLSSVHCVSYVLLFYSAALSGRAFAGYKCNQATTLPMGQETSLTERNVTSYG